MMKKTIIAGLFTMSTVSSASVFAATPIGSGTMTVTGQLGGVATCTVTFPGSITMPTVEQADYNNTTNLTAITRTQTSGITFTGCSGSTVNVTFNSTDSASWSGNMLRILTENSSDSFVALQLADSNNVAYWPGDTTTQNEGRMTNVNITTDTHNIPIELKLMRLSTSSLPTSATGGYSASFLFNATYV